ncbi:MAG: hypothetical protein Q7R58_02900 [bacterium]|nr:hypothetical protein [bacterium]
MFLTREDPFPFFAVITYLVSDPQKVSDNQYTIAVSERRLLFKDGISGGSYPEETKKGIFIVEKNASGRWLITSIYYENGFLGCILGMWNPLTSQKSLSPFCFL